MAETLKTDDEARLDIWASIQREKERRRCALDGEWPPPPLLRKSSSLMSQQSLELCTESLGSETGADELSSSDELDPLFSSASKRIRSGEKGSFSSKTERFGGEGEEEGEGRKEMTRANRHCSNPRASPSPPRSFPPPLSSSSIQIRSTRRDGRLILEAHSAPSYNCLHAERHGGRLLLSFVNPCSLSNPSNLFLLDEKPFQTEEGDDDVESDEGDEDEVERVAEEEEEVQVTDTGRMKGVTVSVQPQVVNRAATVKAFLSSRVINNFAVGNPPAAANRATPAVTAEEEFPTAPPADAGGFTTTPAVFPSNYLHLHHLRPWESHTAAAGEGEEGEVLIAPKWLSRQVVVHDTRPCGELRRPPMNFYVREALLHCHLLLSWAEII